MNYYHPGLSLKEICIVSLSLKADYKFPLRERPVSKLTKISPPVQYCLLDLRQFEWKTINRRRVRTFPCIARILALVRAELVNCKILVGFCFYLNILSTRSCKLLDFILNIICSESRQLGPEILYNRMYQSEVCRMENVN